MPDASFHAKPWNERTGTLVIGRVSHNPQKHYKRLKLIVDFVANRLQDFGIVQGDVLLAKDNQQLIQFLQEGKVDWVTETSFSALFFEEETGAEIVLRRWKKGVPNYRSLFFVRKDSGIASLEDLKGKKIAFSDPGSTTSFLFPSAILKSRGLELVQLGSLDEQPARDKAGYIFTGGDELNVSTWVYKGLADAGAFSDQDWQSRSDTPEVIKKDLRVIYRSEKIPRALELFRKEMPQKIKAKIKEILLNAHNDPQAKTALQAYRQTLKFEEIDDTANKQLGEVRRLYKLMRKELNQN